MNSQRAESQIGDAVFCRDHENRSWLSGVIVSLQPLEIQVQGWPVAMSFNFVCQNLEGKIGDSLLESPEESKPRSDAEPTTPCQSEMEMITQTYFLGLYRFKQPSLVRKKLDRHSTIIRHLAKNDFVNVKSLELNDFRIRAEIKEGGFVTLYNFMNKRELASKAKCTVLQKKCYEHFPKDKIRHLIGEKGKKIKAIRASSNAKIKVFDEKTCTIDDEKAMNQGRYNCLVRITGSSYAVSCAQNSIRALLCTIREYEEKRKAWIIRGLQKENPRSDYWGYNPYRRKYRKQRAYSVRCYKPLYKGVLKVFPTTWEMQKQQHGANGCWVTRKFKNKGKHRSAPRGKRWKRNYHRQGSKKNIRKPKRKYTIQLANNRRLSL